MSELDGIVREFLIESVENLDQVDQDLVELEKSPEESDLIDRVFRAIHTIKGTCGFLGFEKLESVSHVGEELLVKLRDGKLKLTKPVANGLLALVDALRRILVAIESTGMDGEDEHVALKAELVALRDGKGQSDSTTPTAAGAAAPPVKAKPKPKPKPRKPRATSRPKAQAKPGPEPKPEPIAEAVKESAPELSEPAIEASSDDEAAKTLAAALAEVSDPRPETKQQTAEDILKAASKAKSSKRVVSAEGSIRVDVQLLDRLMDLVGELVLARNQLIRGIPQDARSEVHSATQQLNLISSELQEGIMKTRMQPIGRVWGKLPRMVRDLAADFGKEVELIMEGQETELDRSLIEAIKDPLTHIVRNSIDHGLEAPEDRVRVGKSPKGRLLLRAFHEGGQVNIEIADDGRGIDPEKLRQQAIAKGIFSPDQAARMGDAEAIRVIFHPGFSTASKVTNVSGRGVGMDVVKTNIERVNGLIDLASEVGAGTRIKIKIPLTLAIVPALVVNCAEQRYAIPQVSLLELVRLDGREELGKIELIYGVPVYRLRGNLLPLVGLRRALCLPTGERHGHLLADDSADSLTMVILQADNRQFGLVVDSVLDTQEIVVKPLGRHIKDISVFAGATILGDGQVALILDVLGLAQSENVISEIRGRQLAERPEKDKSSDNVLEKLLLFHSPDDGRMAIPLRDVVRLEEISARSVESVGRQSVIQYREQILPLIRVFEHLHERRQVGRGDEGEDYTVPVVVYNHEGNQFGLVVGRIIDIVEEAADSRRPATRDCILATSVIRGRITELLDLQAVLERANPKMFSKA